MRFVRFTTAMIFLLLIAACGARFQSSVENIQPIEINDAWVRPALADGNSAAYMEIVNNTNTPIVLTSVTAESASMIQIHQTVIENEMAQMQHMENGLRIAADNSIQLQPGGYHIMLMNLEAELNEGDIITLTLTFDNDENLIVNAPVSLSGNVEE